MRREASGVHRSAQYHFFQQRCFWARWLHAWGLASQRSPSPQRESTGLCDHPGLPLCQGTQTKRLDLWQFVISLHLPQHANSWLELFELQINQRYSIIQIISIPKFFRLWPHSAAYLQFFSLEAPRIPAIALSWGSDPPEKLHDISGESHPSACRREALWPSESPAGYRPWLGRSLSVLSLHDQKMTWQETLLDKQKEQVWNKMQPANPNAHTYVNGTDVETHGYAVT